MRKRKKISNFLFIIIFIFLLLLIGTIHIRSINEKVPAGYPPDPPENLTASYNADCEEALDLVAPCVLFIWDPNSTGNLTDGYDGTMNGEVIDISANNYQEFNVSGDSSYVITIRAVNKSHDVSYSNYISLNYTAGS